MQYYAINYNKIEYQSNNIKALTGLSGHIRFCGGNFAAASSQGTPFNGSAAQIPGNV